MTATATKKADPEAAISAFLKNIKECNTLIASIQSHLNEHMDVPADGVTWGHVGDSGRVAMDLNQIAAYCNLISES
jgi:hypothetical protein